MSCATCVAIAFQLLACPWPTISKLDEEGIQHEQQEDQQDWEILWQYVHRHTGLPRVYRDLDLMLTLHRPEGVRDHATSSMDYDIERSATAYMALTVIQAAWPDLRGSWGQDQDHVHRFPWAAALVHDSIGGSSVLDQGRTHAVIYHLDEQTALPLHAPILFEVVWSTQPGSIGYTVCKWVQKRITLALFLEQFGYLQACAASHKCTIQVDDGPVNPSVLVFGVGSFARLRGDRLMTPEVRDLQDADGDPLHEPDLTSDSLSEDEEAEESEEEILWDTVNNIYRPVRQAGRAPSLHYAAPELVTLDTRIYETWGDLASVHWFTRKVHPSYRAIHSVGSSFYTSVLVAQNDFTFPQFVILGAVTWQGSPIVKAVVLQSPASRLSCILALGLNQVCPANDRWHCEVILNGRRLEGPRDVYHGDFLWINVRMLEDNSVLTDLMARATAGQGNLQDGLEYAHGDALRMLSIMYNPESADVYVAVDVEMGGSDRVNSSGSMQHLGFDLVSLSPSVSHSKVAVPAAFQPATASPGCSA